MDKLATAQARLLVKDAKINAAAEKFLAIGAKRLCIDEGRLKIYQHAHRAQSTVEIPSQADLDPAAEPFIPRPTVPADEDNISEAAEIPSVEGPAVAPGDKIGVVGGLPPHLLFAKKK